MLPLPPRSTRTDPLLPYTTFCRSSPIPPNFSIRSSRMTSIGPPSLLHDIGEQADVAGALDRTGQLALLLGGHRGDPRRDDLAALRQVTLEQRSEEHTSELQSLKRISYAVFCLKKKNNTHKKQ